MYKLGINLENTNCKILSGISQGISCFACLFCRLRLEPPGKQLNAYIIGTYVFYYHLM